EPALQVHDRRDGPATNHPVDGFTGVRPFAILAKRELDNRSKNYAMRHIEHAITVLGIRIVASARELRARRAVWHGGNVVVVVQWKTRKLSGVKVVFPDLIVLQHAIGVADAPSPTMRHTFRPLNYGRVIPAESLSYLACIDVQELRIRTQELIAENHSAR